MEATPSTNSVTTDREGRNHYVLNADTIRLNVTGNDITGASEIPEPIVPKELAEGIYSNLVFIREMDEEIILDFARVTPSAEQPTVKARVVMNRGAAIALSNMLADKFK